MSTPAATAVQHDRGRASTTAPLQALSYRFVVRCDDAVLGRRVAALFSSLEAPAAGPALHGRQGFGHAYSLGTRPDGTVELSRDRALLATLADADAAVAWLLWDLNREAVDASAEHLVVHAGGVSGGGAGVLMPGVSGAGKSTLTAALVRGGMDYLSDEAVALSPDGGLHPYPKPLSLKEGSIALFDGLAAPFVSVGANGERQCCVAADELRPGSTGGSCRCAVIVMPRYVAGAATALRRLSPTDAFLALALNTVNLARHGAPGARVLGDLVHRCPCFELELSDVAEAAAVVRGLLAEVA